MVTARENRQKADKNPAGRWVLAEDASHAYLVDRVATKTRRLLIARVSAVGPASPVPASA
ncbi:hypothetical protein KBZ21_32035 [Streptomyces sp. A73]|uniref:hypothetical protein n=1 Tax=Streptomyces TaxID=1883 RepID=UPI000C17AC2C|nr:hypothetical protein [Streptomyces sp. RK75]MBQ0865796.1 hypothetical protein [Streptomyces sp. RK75]MBQ1162649.1 hypothetical protein [Streptomyces sp. A73]